MTPSRVEVRIGRIVVDAPAGDAGWHADDWRAAIAAAIAARLGGTAPGDATAMSPLQAVADRVAESVAQRVSPTTGVHDGR